MKPDEAVFEKIISDAIREECRIIFDRHAQEAIQEMKSKSAEIISKICLKFVKNVSFSGDSIHISVEFPEGRNHE